MKILVLALVLSIVAVLAHQHTSAFGEISTLTPPSETIMVNGTNFTIPYSVTTGNITSIQANTSAKTIDVKIQSSSAGNFTIILPTRLIDAFQNASLEPSYIHFYRNNSENTAHFVVMKNNHGIYYNEVDNPDNRSLTIPYRMGNTTIEIKGTYMIPEFGPMAYVILLVSIVSTIAVSRYRLV